MNQRLAKRLERESIARREQSVCDALATVTTIQECEAKQQQIKLPYVAWHDDAERRLKERQGNHLCLMCGLWKWNHERCPLFKHSVAHEKKLKALGLG